VNGVLPRSLAPVPDESLVGYLLRLAYRLQLSPAVLGETVGLTRPGVPLPVGLLGGLPPAILYTFAQRARLSLGEARSLTLTDLRHRYPPADPRFSLVRDPAGRSPRRIAVQENWINTRSSRYCPQCLADSAGGSWARGWLLPVGFACLPHGRLLENRCRSCGLPPLTRPTGRPLLVNATLPPLHPAACRNRPDPGQRRLCGYRLDHTTPALSEPDLPEVLQLQRRLAGLLDPDGPVVTVSAGRAATAYHYLVDLRIVCGLLCASWPAAADLAAGRRAELIDGHVTERRTQIAAGYHAGGRRRDATCYDIPPSDPAANAALLGVAAQILAGELATVRDIMRPLIDQAGRNARTFAQSHFDGFAEGGSWASTGLCKAIGPALAAQPRHLAQGHRAGARRQRRPPRPVAFEARHIPQRPPPEWMDRHFAGITGLRPRVVQHLAVLQLVQMTIGGRVYHAADHLGIPRHFARTLMNRIPAKLAATALKEPIQLAVEALADELDATTGLVDYGRRRIAMQGWTITPEIWATMLDELPETKTIARTWRAQEVRERKRHLASAWAWARVTHGDFIFSPQMRPNGQRPRANRDIAHYVQHRWQHICRRSGTYAWLRQRLISHTDELIAQLDSETDT
jgi:hypothetical protein